MRIMLPRRNFLQVAAGFATSYALFPLGGRLLAKAQGRVILNVVPAQEPDILSCNFSTDAAESITGGKILEPLVRYDAKNKLVGILAESWSVSDDGVVYTFKLRDGIKWHDGKPLTADDVVYSFDVILRETLPRTRGALEKVASIKALDELTAQFTLKTPYQPFFAAINSIGGPVMPKHVYEGTDLRQNPANNAPIGTGPFKFVEWRRGEYVHLVRNENYWQEGAPHIDEIYFQFIPDSAQRVIAMETGHIDVALRQVIPPTDVKHLVDGGHAKLLNSNAYGALGAGATLVINLRKEPFTDVRVRKAMAYAINRQLIIDNAFDGQGTVKLSPFAPGTLYYDPESVVRYDYDPDKSRQLLDQAGLKPGANGVRASFSIVIASANAERQRMMEIVKQEFAEVGLDAQLEFLDVPTLLQRGADWNFDVLFSSGASLQHPSIGLARYYLTSFIAHTYGNNVQGYSNPQVDELWVKADSATDEDEVQKYFSEIQHLMTDDSPTIWIMDAQDNLLVSPEVDNMYQGPLSAYYNWAEVTKGA